MYEAWFWYKKKLIMVPNKGILGKNLLIIFYTALNSNSKAMTNTISDRASVHFYWEKSYNMLDKISLTN